MCKFVAVVLKFTRLCIYFRTFCIFFFPHFRPLSFLLCFCFCFLQSSSLYFAFCHLTGNCCCYHLAIFFLFFVFVVVVCADLIRIEVCPSQISLLACTITIVHFFFGFFVLCQRIGRL